MTVVSSIPGVELELKFALTERQYRILLDHFGPDQLLEVVEQCNAFYDTAGRHLAFWHRHLRVRLEVVIGTNIQRGFLTLKQPAELSPLCSSRYENEVELNPTLAYQLISGHTDINERQLGPLWVACGLTAPDAPLQPLVVFENTRTRIVHQIEGVPYILELDWTTFPNAEINCELEVEIGSVEAVPTVSAYLEEFLERLEIPPVRQRQGKFSRALDRCAPLTVAPCPAKNAG